MLMMYFMDMIIEPFSMKKPVSKMEEKVKTKLTKNDLKCKGRHIR